METMPCPSQTHAHTKQKRKVMTTGRFHINIGSRQKQLRLSNAGGPVGKNSDIALPDEPGRHPLFGDNSLQAFAKLFLLYLNMDFAYFCGFGHTYIDVWWQMDLLNMCLDKVSELFVLHTQRARNSL